MDETASWWRDPGLPGMALWGAVVAWFAFPPASLWSLAVLAPAPVWAMAVCRPSAVAGFRLGWFWGAGFFGTLLWWIVPTVVRYGALPWAAGAGCLGILAAYLALYPALSSACVAAAARRSPAAALVLAPLAWTGLEAVRGTAFTGLPWGDLPQALWQVSLALRVAPWAGIDGARLGIAAVASGGAWLLARPILGARLRGWGLVPAAAAGIAWAAVWVAPPPVPPVEGRLAVGLVQGNIDQAVKWDPAYRRHTLDAYEGLTRFVASQGVDLAVWPETAVPAYVQQGGEEASRVARLAAGLGVPILFGAPAYAGLSPRAGSARNGVFLVDRSGRFGSRYDKVHLVPFGEYVPLGRWLPFVKKLVTGAGDFTPGPGPVVLSAPGVPGLGPLVCFEVIFPALAAAQARAGARVLVVVTNDGWFGRTPGPYQHLAFGAWRAAENGLPLVRAANTGITAAFGPDGGLLGRTRILVADALRVTVPVPGPGVTPQTRVRPWVGPGCLVLAGCGLFAILRRSRRPAPGRVGG